LKNGRPRKSCSPPRKKKNRPPPPPHFKPLARGGFFFPPGGGGVFLGPPLAPQEKGSHPSPGGGAPFFGGGPPFGGNPTQLLPPGRAAPSCYSLGPGRGPSFQRPKKETNPAGFFFFFLFFPINIIKCASNRVFFFLVVCLGLFLCCFPRATPPGCLSQVLCLLIAVQS